MSKRDGFKPLEKLLDPDVRNTFFCRIDRRTGESRANTIEDHYADIEYFGLHDQVPDLVATQYDVARNLYAFA